MLGNHNSTKVSQNPYKTSDTKLETASWWPIAFTAVCHALCRISK